MKDRIAKVFCLMLLAALAGHRTLHAQTNSGVALEYGTNAAAENTNTTEIGSTAAGVATNSNAQVSSQPRPETVITNAGPTVFDFANHTVLYRDHVLVDAPDVKLRCEWLFATLQQPGNQPTNIIAKTNVVIDATDASGRKIHATSGTAVYVYAMQNGATNKMVTLTNNVIVMVTNPDHSVVTQTGPVVSLNLLTGQVFGPAGRTVFQQNLHVTAAHTNAPAVETNLTQTVTNNLSAPK